VAPSVFNYQGRLTDTAGIPLSGNFTMTFQVLNTTTVPPPAPNILFTETQVVTVTNGIFNVIVGSVTPGGVPGIIFLGPPTDLVSGTGPLRYLLVSVCSSSCGSFPTNFDALVPPRRITSSVYSIVGGTMPPP